MSHLGEIAPVPKSLKRQFPASSNFTELNKTTRKCPEYTYVSPYVKFKIYVTLSIT